MYRIDSPRKLERLVIIVEVVLELSRDQYGRERDFMHVEIVETEGGLPHIIPVDVDDGDDEAFLGVLRESVESSQEVGEGDVGDGSGVEDGLAGHAFLPDQLL